MAEALSLDSEAVNALDTAVVATGDPDDIARFVNKVLPTV
jgi:hypothetical protein